MGEILNSSEEIHHGAKSVRAGYHIYWKWRKQRKYFAGTTRCGLTIHDFINAGLGYKEAGIALATATMPMWTLDRAQAQFFSASYLEMLSWDLDYITKDKKHKLHLEKAVKVKKERHRPN